MRIFIGLVTPDQELQRHYGGAKARVIPRDAARRGYFKEREPLIVTSSYAPVTHASASDLERFLLRETKKADACLLLVDQRWASHISNCRAATFSVTYRPDEVDTNKQIFFHRMIARLLRAYGQLAAKFDKGDDAQLLALPLRNFEAAELAEIVRLCREEPLSATFSDNVEAQLAVLRRRVRPRRRSRFKTVYAVDDAMKFFKYGYERHARHETGGLHKPFCDLSGQFRFGRRLDAGRHYNVSETEADTTSVSGFFSNCHDIREYVPRRSHLNMFANDNFSGGRDAADAVVPP